MLALALLLGLRAVAPGEAPSTPGLELRWEAPPECPDRAQLLAAIDATLGDVNAGERRPLRVRGRVRTDPGAGFVVRLELDDGRASTRELRGTSCKELTEAAALVIAMTIDPRLLETLQGPVAVPEPEVEDGSSEPGGGATGGRSPSEVGASGAANGGSPSEAGAGGAADGGSSPEVGANGGAQSELGASRAKNGGSPSQVGASGAASGRSSSAREASDAASAQPSSDPRASGSPASDGHPRRPATISSKRRALEPLRLLGRVQAGVGGGPLPGAAAVLGLAAGLGGRGWRAELSASYWTPRTRTSPANPDVGVRAQLWTLGVHGCGEPRWRTLSFPLCAGLLSGAVHARGVGDLVPRSVATRWVAVALEPGLVWWALPRLGVALRIEGHAALARPTLRSEPSGTVFTGTFVGGAIRAGLELRMP